MKKLILIDIDNTIIDIHGSHRESMDETLRLFYGIDYEKIEHEIIMMQRSRQQDLTAEHPALHISMASRKSSAQTDLNTLAKALTYYESLMHQKANEMPGARSFLEHCQKVKLPVIAITNNYLSIALSRLVKIDLAQYLSHIITPELYGVGKPSPFLFQTILKDNKVTPAQVIMIGDNAVTDGGCRNIGIDFILLEYEKSEQQYKELSKMIQ